METFFDINEYSVARVLPILLQDRTTKRNIIWATGSYAALGEYYRDSGQITAIALRRMGSDGIQPRILKAQEEQQQRTRKHGEVQTPAWLCCRMNDWLDETWFERESVFNAQDGQAWAPAEGKIAFPRKGQRHSSWRQYVDSRRLEITCGEAPFIVSRYDAATGEAIPIGRRIGLLDRKLRVVGENADSEAEWVQWAIRAVQSVYGYEYQGDNLLIARINVLLSFMEYLQSAWHREPTEKELATVANAVSWNFWQMDGLTGTVPKGRLQAPEAHPITMEELGWFDAIDSAQPNERPRKPEAAPPCRVYNWRQAHALTFNALRTQRGRDVRNMRFDYVIGNPPYQEEVENNGRATPIYPIFMDASYNVANIVELITPARFLFNAGQTPKEWNRKMLSDPHFKVLHYVQNSKDVFPNAELPGGICISYRNESADYGAIGTFTSYNELNSIQHKVSAKTDRSFSDIIVGAVPYRFSNKLKTDHPELIDVIGSSFDVRTNVLNKLEGILFFREKPSDNNDYVSFIGLLHGKRAQLYIRRDYIIDTAGIIDRYNLLLSESNGAAGQIGKPVPARIIGEAYVAKPCEGHTQTFISIGAFSNIEEMNAVNKYLKTRFLRVLLGIKKVTQHNPKETWRFVPLQDFTPASDIDWTQPIPAIDQQLYRKYGLSDEEIAFIESHVKEMT